MRTLYYVPCSVFPAAAATTRESQMLKGGISVPLVLPFWAHAVLRCRAGLAGRVPSSIMSWWWRGSRAEAGTDPRNSWYKPCLQGLRGQEDILLGAWFWGEIAAANLVVPASFPSYSPPSQSLFLVSFRSCIVYMLMCCVCLQSARTHRLHVLLLGPFPK